jgi:predicted nucleotidyltransferase
MLPPDVTEIVRGIVARHPDVRAVYAFGSRARGDARTSSDLDLGVLYRTPQPLDATLRLEQAIGQQVGVKTDLVDLARAGAFLALEIVRGDRLFDRDATETDRFELYVLRRAGDLLPFERQRQALLLNTAS